GILLRVDADDRALVEFVATRDAACPVCSYNLRGLTAAVCPECSARLHLRVGSENLRLGPWFAGVVSLAVGLGFDGVVSLMIGAVSVALTRPAPIGSARPRLPVARTRPAAARRGRASRGPAFPRG